METLAHAEASDGSLPIMEPLHNVREVAKQLILLEDHLFHPERHCEDCITKHLLTAEAFAEEARSLDVAGEFSELLNPLPGVLRRLFRMFQEEKPVQEIAQAARKLRKRLMPETLKVRVASRWLSAERGRQVSDLPRFLMVGNRILNNLNALKRAEAEGRHDRSVVWALNTDWSSIVSAGRRWSEEVIETRATPRGKAKKIELAVRAFQVSRTRDSTKWLKKNRRHIELLIEAERWPLRSEASDDLARQFQQGSFTVHNTIHAEGNKLQAVRDMISAASRALPRTGLAGAQSMAYGDLLIVGQIGRASWAAWYTPSKDNIAIRPFIRGISAADAARHLVHEIGHRYWHKVIARDRDLVRAWHAYHRRLGSQPVDPVAFPGVGEQLPHPIHMKILPPGRKRRKRVLIQPTVKARGSEWVEFEEAPGVRYSVISVQRILENTGRTGRFPSPYAATDPQEHFCEAFSFKAFGELSPEGVEAFDRIFLGRTAADRVADRWSEQS